MNKEALFNLDILASNLDILTSDRRHYVNRLRCAETPQAEDNCKAIIDMLEELISRTKHKLSEAI